MLRSESIKFKCSMRLPNRALMDNPRDLRDEFQNCKILHVHRSGKLPAHLLANFCMCMDRIKELYGEMISTLSATLREQLECDAASLEAPC